MVVYKNSGLSISYQLPGLNLGIDIVSPSTSISSLPASSGRTINTCPGTNPKNSVVMIPALDSTISSVSIPAASSRAMIACVTGCSPDLSPVIMYLWAAGWLSALQSVMSQTNSARGRGVGGGLGSSGRDVWDWIGGCGEHPPCRTGRRERDSASSSCKCQRR